MVWVSVRPQHHVIPRDVLHILHRTQRLTYRQQVWIGHYVGAQPHHSFREVAAHIVGVIEGELDDPNEAHAYLAAISVGQLAFLIYGHLLGVPNPHRLPTAMDAKLVQIWPPESEVLSWPPLRRLTTSISRRRLLRSVSRWAERAAFPVLIALAGPQPAALIE